MSITIVGGGNPSGPTFPVQRSVRLRSSASAYFGRTLTTPTNNKIWTWSAWVKRGKPSGTSAAALHLFGTGSGSTDAGTTQIYFDNENLVLGGYSTPWLKSNAVYRDPSAWYHIVVAWDNSNATATNRAKIYVNGVEITYVTDNRASLSTTSTYGINQAVLHTIGAWSWNNGTFAQPEYYDGYLTEINFIDGQALTPTSFGAYNSFGVWSPAKYSGSYGTNGFYLNFQDNSASTATTIGKDSSGNGNNWTPNNISVTAGATYDSMLDVPTLTSSTNANYPTFSPIDTGGGSVTLSGGNLNYSIAASTGSQVRGTMGTGLTGKWYWEYTAGSAASPSNPQIFGLSTTEGQITNNTTSLRKSVSAYSDGSTNRTILYYLNGTLTSNYQIALTSVAIGDILQIAYDAATGKVWFGKNNSWLDASNGTTGNPSAGTNQTVTIATGDSMTPFLSNLGATYSGSLNCGQRPFSYTPPTGFKSLNTYNLPAPTIANGAAYMAATTYSGNGSTQSLVNTVNGVNFQPDFVWVKSRSSGTQSHQLFDSVRGVSKPLNSSNTNAEVTYAGQSLTAFNSNGFTVVDDAAGNLWVNGSTGSPTYVGWQWKGGGTAVTNTSGSISSSVSANPSAGFSIVTYTGTGANATVGHGLGVAPKMVIVKLRSGSAGTAAWVVYHSSDNASPQSGYMRLDGTGAFASDTTAWNNTAPTSSVFSIGTLAAVNYAAANNYVAYCFSEIAGYSKFGSYTGNGSADGPFIYTGFRPRYVMIKGSSFVSNWFVIDTSRNTYNVAPNALRPNLSDAETSTGTYSIDILSNGFKLRSSAADANTSSATFIYACFAENPFNYSLAR